MVREEFSGRVHFPNSEGNFNLSTTFGNNLVVEGPPSTTATNPSITISSTPGPSYASTGVPGLPPRAMTSTSGSQIPPYFKSVLPTSRGKGPGGSLKVILAKMETAKSSKVTFAPESQMFVDLTEATASVDYILTTIRRQWGEHITMVSCDGVEFENSPGSQGKSSCMDAK